ncbi:MAG TPA: putative zinc-binding metallopeptidase, partial [Oligoflexus sp.]|uniref:putative zinc-binding metallopeptidase n=1 Tax=Oligoflexus sp. TaxID=1971216 RepID=UPI002D415FFB
QKMFCSVRHFYIESDLTSLAYARSLTSNGKTDGVVFGIRKSLFDNRTSAQDVMSWKEQTNFTEAPEYEVRADLPRVVFKETKSMNLALYYILVHEFGHFFDFANNVSANGCEKSSPNAKSCSYSGESTWGSLSWDDYVTIKSDLALIEPKSFCFYSCEENTRTRASHDSLYEGFEKMPFATTYATGNSVEDFAETFTFHVNSMSRSWEKSYLLPSGKSISLTERYESELLEKKRTFVRKFLEQEALLYP